MPDNYVPSVAYVMQAYQAGVNTALNFEALINGHRIVRVRTNPFSMRTNGANQLEVNTGNTMKQDADGVDAKHDHSIREDLAFGIGVNLSEVSGSMQLNVDGIAVNLREFGGLTSTPGLAVGVSVDNVTIQVGADGLLNGNYQVMYPQACFE